MNPRVVFFTDSFREANGVALTSREYVRFFRENDLPLLAIYPGTEFKTTTEGSVTSLELPPSRFGFGLEHDLGFDLGVLRHSDVVIKAIREFAPDLIHITGPGHCGIFGTILAHRLRIPMASSWHTNVHEYAGRRTESALGWLPAGIRNAIGGAAENASLYLTGLYYSIPKMTFAPNPELVEMLHKRTKRPSFVMARGVDTARFSPSWRTRNEDDGEFVIGYVGRLSPEKNVRLLGDIQKGLAAAGIAHYRFLIVGDGGEREWLQRTLKRAELTGVLRGEQLSTAYANMDVLLFPSRTDTFGNVVLEALASAVPAVVTSAGGPKFIVRAGVNGFIADRPEEFVTAVLDLARDPELNQRMRQAARDHALEQSWASVFQGVYDHYRQVLGPFERSWGRSPACQVT